MSDILYNGLFRPIIYLTVIWIPALVLSVMTQKMLTILGRKTTLLIGLIGVPIHELSHAIMCLMCNHKITKISFYNPSNDGTMGYVNHQYRQKWITPFTLFVIGIAPFVGGWLAFALLTQALRPDLMQFIKFHIGNVNTFNYALDFIFEFLIRIVSQGSFASTVVWVIAGFSILVFSVPSKSDFNGCSQAVFVMLGLYLLWVVVAPAAAQRAISDMMPMFAVAAAPMYMSIIMLLPLFFLMKTNMSVAQKVME